MKGGHGTGWSEIGLGTGGTGRKRSQTRLARGSRKEGTGDGHWNEDEGLFLKPPHGLVRLYRQW